MTTYRPSFWLLVPGPWTSAEQVRACLLQAGVAQARSDDSPLGEGEVRATLVSESAGFGVHMSWGREGRLPAQIVRACSECSCAALVEVSGRLDAAAGIAARVGRALKERGGVAVRMEGSGGASEWEPWLKRLEASTAASLAAAALVFVGGEGGTFFTAGMHQFELPDAELIETDPGAAIPWLEAFCTYCIGESPSFSSGHTFSPNASTPRRKIERWPDSHHHPHDGRFNPWGLWRGLAVGDLGLEAGALECVIMPALHAILTIREREAGRLLTRADVESIVDAAPAIAMEIADARRLERARGCMDIEPRRAWEQWQIVRAR